MEENSVSYGTPTNGASPGANPILAQPPLPDAGEQSEGTLQSRCEPVAPGARR